MIENRFRIPDLPPPPVTPADVFTAGPPLPKRKKLTYLGRLGQLLRGILVQNGLLGLVERNFRFTLFLTAVGMFYIWNSHQAHKQAMRATRLEREIKELKSEYHTLSAQLSTARQQSQIGPRVLDSLDLRPSEKPPFKLIVKAGPMQNQAAQHQPEVRK